MNAAMTNELTEDQARTLVEEWYSRCQPDSLRYLEEAPPCLSTDVVNYYGEAVTVTTEDYEAYAEWAEMLWADRLQVCRWVEVLSASFK